MCDLQGLMCEQHKLQVGHRRGLPDWTTPSVPAGVSTSEHERVPAFFAWGRADVQPAPAAAVDTGGRPSSAQVAYSVCLDVSAWMLTMHGGAGHLL